MTHTKKIGVGLVLAAAIAVAVPSFASAATLYRSLDVGSRGADVTALQSFLAQDSSLYPSGLVTGYFGSLTRAGVINFQIRNGISAVGRVGPITLASLNEQMAGSTIVGGADVSAPVIYSVSTTANNSSATISWSTTEAARGTVYYSTSPMPVTENMGAISINGSTATSDSNFKLGQNVTIPNLSRDTTYYYMIVATDAFGNLNVTWPATIRTQQ